jgi:tRNA-dihydrouridine synthase C
MFIKKGTPALVLAPMDGVTDSLMRDLLSKLMPVSYSVSEFIRVSAEVPPKRTFFVDVPELKNKATTPCGTPVQVQLLGGHPGRLAEAAARAVELGAQGIDLNFGCPAPTVNRHDGGATILKSPHRVEEIVGAVRSVVPREIPVSAKMRLGWDDPEAIYENAYRAERGGASWITIHGRTKTQGYTPPAYWNPIGKVRQNSDVPIVANGEIWSVDDLRRCREESGCEHFMVGRGALAEPGLLRRLAIELGLEVVPNHVDICGGDARLWTPLIERLVELSVSSGEPERRTLARVKQWLSYGAKKGAVTWFGEVKRCENIASLLSQLKVVGDRSEAAATRRAA